MSKKSDQETKKLLIVIGSVALIFILFMVSFLLFKSKPETATGLITKTLEGKENPETNYLYKGFVFIKSGSLWQTTWQKGNIQYNVLLHYSPLELEDIEIIGGIDERFHSDEIYITFDPTGSYLNYVALSAGELSLSLVRALDIAPVAACSKNETLACSVRPIINCTNTDKAVIFLKEDPETKIDLRGNCIILQGTGAEIVKVTDRLIYQWYGIMKD